MKTAISLPDELFEAAEQAASRLGLSRSDLYARALASFLREHDGVMLTEAIDRVLKVARVERLDSVVAKMQANSLGADEGSLEDWVNVRKLRTRRRRA